MQLSAHVKHFLLIFIMIYIFLLVLPGRICQAALFENLAICAKGISLANSCTAYPPGQMSIHYNPAGLSNVRDGIQLSQGFLNASFSLDANFKANPDFDGWLGGVSGSAGGQNYDFSIEADRVAGQSSEIEGLHLFIPVMGEEDMRDSISMPTPFGFSVMAAPFPFAMSYRKPNSRWTFGFGIYAPSMGGYFRDDEDPGSYNGRAVSMQHIVYAAPSVSYQLTDTLSVGLTMGLGQGATQLDTLYRTPNDMVALTKILGASTQGLAIPVISQLTLPPPWFGGGIGPYETIGSIDIEARDDYVPSYNLGLLWEPNNWFSFGLCYQSEVEMEQHGTFEFNYNKQFQRMVAWMGSSPLLLAVSSILDLPYRPTASQKGSINMEGMDTPEQVHAGIMLRPFKWLRLMCDVHYIDYSQTDAYKIIFDQDIQVLEFSKFLGHTDGDREIVINMDMKDDYHISLGAELQLLEWLSLRFGWEDRQSSINKDYFTLIAPVVDSDYYGTGLGIELKSGLKIDLAFGYLVSDKWHMPSDSSENLNSTKFTDAVYSPYGGLDIEGDLKATFWAANFTFPFKYLYRIGHVLKDFGFKIANTVPYLPEEKANQLDVPITHNVSTTANGEK